MARMLNDEEAADILDQLYEEDVWEKMDKILRYGRGFRLILDREKRPCILCERTDDLPPLEADICEWGAWVV